MQTKLLVVFALVAVALAQDCAKHKDCPKTDFCSKDLACQKCKTCAVHTDSVTGKCPCGPAKKKGKKAAPKEEPEPEDDEGGDGGPQGAPCKKHKDCPKTDFCSQEGCLKCKECNEGAQTDRACSYCSDLFCACFAMLLHGPQRISRSPASARAAPARRRRPRDPRPATRRARAAAALTTTARAASA
jgi:hypothetical protein